MFEQISKRIPADRRDAEAGWTFVETLIVVGIILVLSSSVGFAAFRYLDQAKQATARNQVEVFSVAITSYFLDTASYPTPEQGLEALWQKPTIEPVPANWSGPYLTKPVPEDPWGRPYDYLVPDPNGLPFGIRSLGADQTEGGEGNDADVTSWGS